MKDSTDVDGPQAARCLCNLEDIHHVLFDESSDGIFISESRGRNVAVNARGLQLSGYAREEILGLNRAELILPQSDVGSAPLDAESGEDGTAARERRLRRKDGSLLPVEASTRTLPDGRLLTIVHDISHRKRAEATLRDSEARYEQLAAQTRTFLWEVDANGLYTFVSPMAQPVLGYGPEELVGKLHFYDLHPQEGREEFKAAAFEMFARKAPFVDRPNEALSRDGRKVWLTTYAVPLLGRDGELLGYRGGDIDISERRNAEDALRKSEQRLRALIDSAPFGAHSYELDANDRLVFSGFNRSANRILGLDNAQFLGKAVDDAFPSLAATALPARYRHVAMTGEAFETEQVAYEDGRIHGVFSVHAFQTAPRSMAALFIDVTEHRRAEEEKAKLQAHLHQSQKMESIGRLAGGVAHDFNNMLGVILGHTEMALKQTEPAHPLFEHVQEIRKAAERSANLTRQLLAFARKQTVAPKVIDLNQAVDSMLSMLRRLIGEDIDLAWKPDAQLWSVKVDPSQIDQILANLCVNARDAIRGVGKVTIETKNTTFDAARFAEDPDVPAGDYLMLAVSDNGCGMDQATVDHLFEPFFTTKGVGRGTGMGMPMVYGIVKQNRGFINVYSEPGHGTAVKVYLPRHGSGTDRRPKERATAPSATGHEIILLVEDEPANLNMCKLMLKSFGYGILVAATPGEALRVAREHAGQIQLLMTDVVMPEMNGRDLARRLQALYPDIKSLFMSGYTANVIAHHGVLADGVHFIQKPFSMKELAAAVRSVLDSK